MFTFWRINLDASLQYQLGDFDKKKLATATNFTCMDYTPPLSSNSTVLLLIGLSNFEVWGIDTKTNCLVIKYPADYFYNIDFEKNKNSYISNNINNNILIKETEDDNVHNININSNNNYKSADISLANIQKSAFRFIICTVKYIVFIFANVIKTFKLPYPLSEINYEKLDIFMNKPNEMIVDSDVISVDIDIMDNSEHAICVTKKGNVWAMNFAQNSTLRIFSFQAELKGYSCDSSILALNTNCLPTNAVNSYISNNHHNSEVVNYYNNSNILLVNGNPYNNTANIGAYKCYSFQAGERENDLIIQSKIISKSYQTYSLKKINFEERYIEDCSPEVKENEHYYITGHKGGCLKVWSLPEFSLTMNFEVVTEELVCFEISPNDLKLIAAYKSKESDLKNEKTKEKIMSESCLRFFDIGKEKFLGKYKPASSEAFKMLKFLPDGNFFFAVDMKNVIFLVKIESYSPLLLQIHQIISFNSDILGFDLSPIDAYNKFLINIQNVEMQVYSRKFTNILKNLSYDSSVPQFYLQDKFMFNEYFKNEADSNANLNLNKKLDISREAKELKAKVHEKLTPMTVTGTFNKLTKKDENNFNSNALIAEYYLCNFCFHDKNLVYVLSHARKSLTIRNIEKHINILNISLTKNPINFAISPNSGYIIILFKGTQFV